MDKVLHKNSRTVVLLRIILVSYLITGCLLLLLTFLALKMDISEGIVAGGIIASYVISSLVAGFLAGKGASKKRYLWGVLMGGIYFAVLVVIALLTNTVVGMDTGRILWVLAICIFSGMVGGMLS